MASKNILKRFIALQFCYLIILLSPATIFAQDRFSSGTLAFRQIGIKEGLSAGTVNSLYQDSNGFIWSGNTQGLDRYDGVRVKQYPMPHLVGYITSIQEYGKINLLVGTEKGLKIFNRKTETFSNFTLDNVTLPFVKYIYSIDSNSFLVGAENGLYYVENNKAEKILLSNSGSLSNDVVSITPASVEKCYWIATKRGLHQIDLLSKKTSSYLNTISDDYMCMQMLDGYIYLGTYNRGVIKFSTRTSLFSPLSLTRDAYIKCMDIDHYGRIYIGTDGRGLLVYNPKSETFSKISRNDNPVSDISSTTILSLIVDRSTLWLGTNTGGINYSIFTSTNFQNYQFKSFNSSVHHIRSFLVVDQHKKIIGTREGLFYIDEKNNIVKRFSAMGTQNVLRSDIVTHIYPYTDDQYIIGTFGGGAYLFDIRSQSLKKIALKSTAENCSIFRITGDYDGNIWLATDQGLICMDRKLSVIKKLDTSNSGLTNNTLGYMICDLNNCIWTSSPYGGLFFLDIRSGIVKSNLIPPPYDTVASKTNYIYEDTERNIWLGTNHGILVVNPSFNKIKHYTSKNLLPHDVVKSIVQDKNGCFWITTLQGIVKFDYKKNQHRLFGKDDGVKNYSFNNVVQRSDDGQLWWSNEQGLLFANPKKVLEKSSQPRPQYPPQITAIRINAREASAEQLDHSSPIYARSLNLSSDDDDISFSFSLMSYSLDEEVKYHYMLEGYDSTWISSNENQVSYYNLAAGSYKFRIRNPKNHSLEKSIELHVSPNYYIYLLYLVVIGLTALSAYLLFRKRRQKDILPPTPVEIETREKEISVKYSTIPLKKAADIQLGLKELMEQKKYIDPDLKAQDLAVLLHCSTFELSQVFSSYLNTNFNDYINNFRFKEFISLLSKENLSKYTLDALSEQCGFKSRSTFYRTVKKETGKSPMEYVKEIQKRG